MALLQTLKPKYARGRILISTPLVPAGVPKAPRKVDLYALVPLVDGMLMLENGLDLYGPEEEVVFTCTVVYRERDLGLIRCDVAEESRKTGTEISGVHTGEGERKKRKDYLRQPSKSSCGVNP
jgi:hypothetical protein